MQVILETFTALGSENSDYAAARDLETFREVRTSRGRRATGLATLTPHGALL